jgi:hypothetical protein
VCLGDTSDVARYFTLLDAEALLPEIEKLLNKLIEFKRELERVEGEMGRIQQKIAFAGGMIPPRAEILSLQGRKQQAMEGLKSAVDAILETGCLLKDIDSGLVDFPTLYLGKEVYLCWKLGEKGITFWHYVEDGFRGRKPIDSEFLQNHRGDLSH